MGTSRTFHLFEVVGVELEYMIVDRDTLAVRPIADEILRDDSGAIQSEIECGAISWSNELVLHVIELKTNGPAADMAPLWQQFQEQVEAVNCLLAKHNAMLLPTAMHPAMDPFKEMQLWPHEFNPVYEAYNRIFDCRGHGWANLQSTHINLPFANDAEFEKLHAAIRVLLPLLPGLAASSPIAENKLSGYADYRLEVYRHNSERIPSVTGVVIPEGVFSEEQYEKTIFQAMYRDISPHDSGNILQHEWLNSRGAIARFDRGSIEIRVLDIQESPLADMAIVRLITDTLKALCGEQWRSLANQKSWDENSLAQIFLKVIGEGEKTAINDNRYLELFGINKSSGVKVQAVWQSIFEALYTDEEVGADPVLQAAGKIIRAGTLSTRIKNVLPEDFSEEEIRGVYCELCGCLQQGTLFRADE